MVWIPFVVALFRASEFLLLFNICNAVGLAAVLDYTLP